MLYIHKSDFAAYYKAMVIKKERFCIKKNDNSRNSRGKNCNII